MSDKTRDRAGYAIAAYKAVNKYADSRRIVDALTAHIMDEVESVWLAREGGHWGAKELAPPASAPPVERMHDEALKHAEDYYAKATEFTGGDCYGVFDELRRARERNDCGRVTNGCHRCYL